MSALAHLATGVFGGACQERIMCILDSQFTCHWDESGNDPGTETRSKADRPLLLVGGYLAHVREWEQFNAEWKSILDKYNLPFFHMTDFANMRKPYSQMLEDDRNTLISSLLDIIAKWPRVFVGWAIETDAYMEVIKARNLLEKDIVRAYHICARKCIETVSVWAIAANYKPKILHIFDQGNSAWPSFEASCTQQVLDAYNILKPISQSKVDVLPLQAADVFAHQVARNLLISAGKVKGGLRLYTEKLFGTPGMLRYIDAAELRGMYAEELAIERLRSRGVNVRRDIDPRKLSPLVRRLVTAFFTEPEEARK